ncbi:hypothetical protein Q8F55_003852 [Vanrija albida]|uniref:C2 NT-type domain-containing protein n=1 Tax=Vanrija albida TaxID=181172 RepID=A0ABR3Q541_9TREE
MAPSKQASRATLDVPTPSSDSGTSSATPAPSIRNRTATPTMRSASSTTHRAVSSASTAAKSASTTTVDDAPHSHSKFGSKLRKLFEHQKHATFQVNVTIHELSNIPQLEGDFAVRWKFRGHRPRHADQLLASPARRIRPQNRVSPKPSVPNLRTLRPSSSAMSLRSASTTTAVSPVAGSSRGGANGSSNWLAPHREHTLPITHREQTHPAPLPTKRKQEKKGSDPTPLRQSLRAQSVGEGAKRDGDGCPPVVDEPELLGHNADENDAVPLSASSSRSNQSPITPLTASSTAESDSVRDSASIVSKSSRAPSLTASRPWESNPSARWSSISDSSQALPSPSAPSDSPLMEEDSEHVSHERKGMTEIFPIKAHAVTWEQELQHVIRLPIEVPEGSQGHLVADQSIPLLVGGPKSDAGIKFEIHQSDKKTDDTTSRDRSIFGYVDVDLAPFADLGKTTRRFLLKDSKTNATLRVTVTMRFIGGDQDWIAPTLQDGHLVRSINELHTDESALGDLQLYHRPSISSQSDTSSVSGRPSFRSSASNASVTKVYSAVVAPRNRYTAVEHHLLPDESKNRRRGLDSAPASADSSVHDLRSAPTDMSQFRQTKNGTLLTESPQASPSLQATALSVDTSYFDQPTAPEAPRSQLSGFGPAHQDSLLSPDQAPRGHRHAHHDSRHSLEEKHNILPEVVIEHVFNPTASHEFTPFTYVKESDTSEDEEELTDELDNEPNEVDLSDHPVGGQAKICWSKIRRRAVTHLPHPHHRHRMATLPTASR